MYLDLRDLGYLDLRDFGGCFVRIAALSYGSQAGSFEIHTGGGRRHSVPRPLGVKLIFYVVSWG